ncbi:MAG: hypothetical protein ACOH2B_05340 [Burkholderiaceae bacterium]
MLSKLASKPCDIDLNTHLPSFQKQRGIDLPVGFLPILRIGDIWREERYITSPSYTTESFQDVLIDDDHCTSIVASAFESTNGSDSKRFLLPLAHHPFHMNHPRSKCVLISLPGSENKIIIPQLELARFYFGSSSALIAKLFSYGMILNEIYDYNATIPHRVDGSSFIQLRTKMKDKSAADIARIALDANAKHAATLISKSIVKCAREKRSIYAETVFPFKGVTTLTLIGKWLPYTAVSKIFVCYRIVRCTAPFPFESLEFFRDNAGNTDGTTDLSRPKAFEDSSPRPTSTNIDGSELLTDDEPYAFLDDTEILIPEETPFPDLGTKDVEKVRQKSCENQSADPTEVIPISTDGLGIGEGGTDSAISPADVGKEDVNENETIATVEKLPADFQTFFKILDALRRCNGIEEISFECPYPGAIDSRCSVFPLVKTETGRESAWPFIDYIKTVCPKKRLRRRVIVVRIHFDKKIRYLLEIERRVDPKGNYLDKCSMLLLHSHMDTAISENDLKAVLTECAERHGGWLSDDSLTHLHRYAFKHTFSKEKLENEVITTFMEKIISKL